MVRPRQATLFPDLDPAHSVTAKSSSTFVNNMKLPVHRWFRYSAGFSAEWVENVIKEHSASRSLQVFDPFAGSATTLLAAERMGVECCGVESHPFISRVARAKLAWKSCPGTYLARAREIRRLAESLEPSREGYPPLIYKCYDDATLDELDVLRQAYELTKDDTPASELAWLTLVAILRTTSRAGTAQWQYVLPRKQKRTAQNAIVAYDECVRMIHRDMLRLQPATGPEACLVETDARTCQGVPDGSANLVITSPPYPNNYDYADATRLEMSFMREIRGWGDLQQAVRCHLIRSCTQHVPERTVDLEATLSAPILAPILDELTVVCNELAKVRRTKGGKKTYHLMVACYLHDLALAWQSLRRVCAEDAKVCFVIGDSAPYGVYVPVIPWLGKLAISAGFKRHHFEKTRDRNIKWKNRKHRVPLQEGRLWVEG
jgi:DNA methylase